MSLNIHLLQEVLGAVKVLNSQVVVAKGEALLVGDLPDAGVRPLTTLQLPLLSLLQSIDLQVIWGAKSKLLSYVVIPGGKKSDGKMENLLIVICNFILIMLTLNPP